MNTTKITEKLVINAEAGEVVLNGLDFTKNGYVEITNAKSVVIKNCRIYKMNCEGAAKNYWLNVKGDLPMKLCVTRCFFGDNPGTSGKLYNLFEMNAKLQGNSQFSHNWFSKNCCTHNTINIYGADEGATIFVNGNHFEDMARQIRVGIKGNSECKLIVNGNYSKVVDTTPEGLEWANLLLAQPYGKATTTFENLTIEANDNEFTYTGDNLDKMVAYFGGGDTPLGRTSAPNLLVDGKAVNIPIRTGSSKAVAVVGTTAYQTLAEALSNANGETVTLVNSTEEDIDITTLVGAHLVAGRPGLTVHGVEVEF